MPNVAKYAGKTKRESDSSALVPEDIQYRDREAYRFGPVSHS